MYIILIINRNKELQVILSIRKKGSTETRTRIVGFKVQSANHYTIEPVLLASVQPALNIPFYISILAQPIWLYSPNYIYTLYVLINPM